MLSRRKLKMEMRKCMIRVSKALIIEIAEALKEEIWRKKKEWVRGWLVKRNTHGASALLLKELATEDMLEYKMCLRMSPANFDKLLEMVTQKINRQDTLMRDAISPRVKLEVTLVFLATGNNYRSLSHFFRVSKSTISKFIPEVCDAIVGELGDFIKVSRIILRFFSNSFLLY